MGETMVQIGATILGVLALVLWMASFVHAAIQPDGAWAAVRRRRSGWIVGLALFGWIVGIVYFISVRPGLRAAVLTTTRHGRNPERKV